MKFVVGGRELELTQSQVASAMQDQVPDLVRQYFVDLPTGLFPTKQILAVVTGWDRGSFTSHEANRVLGRLGFVCQRLDGLRGEVDTAQADRDQLEEGSTKKDLLAIRSSIKVLEAAVAGIADRLGTLESLD
jgi:hypothetical protein